MLTYKRELLVGIFSIILIQAAYIPLTTSQPYPTIAWISSSLASPSTTPQPKIAVREVNSVCGIWSTWITTLDTYTISCDAGVPCVFASVSLNLVRGYCSTKGAQPITEAFSYGPWPTNGCQPGQLCCNSDQPLYGTYVFNNGGSSLTRCGSTGFWQTATGTILAVSASPTTPVNSTSPDTSGGNNNPSSKWTTAQIIGTIFGVLGGVGTFIGGIVAILSHRHRKRKDRQKSGASENDATQLARIMGSGVTSPPATYHLHNHGTLNVHVYDSQLHLSSVNGGGGAPMTIGRRGGRPLLLSQGSSNSTRRLLSN